MNRLRNIRGTRCERLAPAALLGRCRIGSGLIGAALLLTLAGATVSSLQAANHGNRLAYLDDPVDPYYVHGAFPRLATRQWVGRPGVDAVIVLAIDDMRDPAKYERFLRPILDRLREIDGRAPVSIMTNQVDPQEGQLQKWVAEGLSLEVHTIDHPCPLLQGGDFAKARSTYDRCVDMLSQIPGSKPVAFRMPCCDSMNTPSPRFFREIFGKKTASGHWLSIDSSVFNILPPAPGAPPDQFTKYLPFRNFVNTIDDYPYPYLIDHSCWQFPCVVPSDWEAQNIQQSNNPQTVEDWKRALDLCVERQGAFDLVFHPHGWIRSNQIVELIDYATRKYGKRVLFLTFRECDHLLTQQLLAGVGLRSADGAIRGVSLVDVNADGWMDVVSPEQVDGSGKWRVHTRFWLPQQSQWRDVVQEFPGPVRHFGILNGEASATVAVPTNEQGIQFLSWTQERWQARAVKLDGERLGSAWSSRVQRAGDLDAIRLRDLDGDGSCELLLQAGSESVLLRLDQGRWRPLPFALPQGVRIARADGTDAGCRLIDIDGDEKLDCLFSDPLRYRIDYFDSLEAGWSRTLIDQVRSAERADPIPPFVLPDGSNNGVWYRDGSLWYQNEQTDRLPDKVLRVVLSNLDDRRACSATEPTSAAESIDASEPSGAEFPDAVAPPAAVSTFRLAKGWRIELLAAEPLVQDPIAFDWHPDGSLWVVEMGDYPSGIDGAGKAGGRVKRLVDTDGDGRFDRSTLFLDGLPFPTGIKVWRDGVLVTAAPDLLFARDTDNDGRADEQQVLYTGFSEGNQQHRINGLRWGVDGWLYLANGESGGSVRSLRSGQQIDIRGRDLRIDPDTGRLEALSGQSQYGRATDGLGTWFGNNNSEPFWHYVLEDRYLSRNPYADTSAIRHLVPEQSGPAPVYPISRTLPRFNDFDRANRFTSACSPLVYRGQLLAPASGWFTFVCEPVHNLIHREQMVRQGVTYHSHRLPDEQASEAIRSTDNWFRPVMVRTGPDGGLWIADMYRLVIEHPTWIPKAWQEQLDVRAGSDRGRIYRVVPSGWQADRTWIGMDRRSTKDLVASLGHSNGTVCDMAQQILTWRADPAALSALRRVVREGEEPAAVAALYLLHQQGHIDPITLRPLITDRRTAVAKHAMILSEPFLSSSPQLGEAIVARLGSAEKPLVMQIGLTLGQWNDPRAAAALAQILDRYGSDRYLRAAVLSSLNADNVRQVFDQFVKRDDTFAHGSLQETLAEQAVALAKGDAADHVLRCLLAVPANEPAAWQMRAIAKCMDRLRRRDKKLEGVAPETGQLLVDFSRRARLVAADSRADTETRLAAIALLRPDLVTGQENLSTLGQLLSPAEAPELQREAIESLLAYPVDPAISLLLDRWPGFSPALRSQVLELLLQRPAHMRRLIELATDRRASLHLTARVRQRLRDQSILPAGSEQLAGPVSADARREIVESTIEKLEGLTGDAERGLRVFTQRCATCHKIGSVGHAVGPDLATLTNRSLDALVPAILDPNRAIEDAYHEYTLITADGRQLSGLVEAETGAAVRLLGPDGKSYDVPRSEIDVLQSTGRSLMPEGLEKDLTPQDLVDVIALLRINRPPRKSFPGNRPQLAPMRDDGSIRLFAVHAEIYGPSLVFEEKYRNLGFWSSPQDHAVWTVSVSEPKEYDVVIDYACPTEEAGNRLRIDCRDQSIVWTVRGTGSWDNYGSAKLGTLVLPVGKSQIVVHSDGPVRGHLLDLRTLFLYPHD